MKIKYNNQAGLRRMEQAHDDTTLETDCRGGATLDVETAAKRRLHHKTLIAPRNYTEMCNKLETRTYKEKRDMTSNNTDRLEEQPEWETAAEGRLWTTQHMHTKGHTQWEK
jgi:hypothetical protein